VPEGVRKLAAYAIAAHTHYTKPIKVKQPEGYERPVYWYELWSPDDKPVGLAVLLARFADRLDTNGVTLFARHLVDQADAAELGGGKDYTGKEFFEINEESLQTMFLPQVREGNPKPPTVLEHMWVFANSNFGASIYSRDDHLFPAMTRLMLIKVYQTWRLTDIVTKETPLFPEASEDKRTALVGDVLRQISGSPKFDRSWDVLARTWEELPEEHQVRWYAGFTYVRDAYLSWLDKLVEYASRKEEYAAFARELAERCR
jgi:hypothetical protein